MAKLKNADEATVKFLLEEFQQIEGERLRLKGEAVQRLNFFLTITSALLGGLVLFGQISLPIRLEYILLSALFFLVTIGWQTFRFIIARDINTDKVLRAGGRIRRYFTNRDIELRDYVTWQDDDEPSKYVTENDSAIRRTSQIVLAFLLGIMFGIIAFIFVDTLVTPIIIGFAGFITLVFFFEFYSQREFKRA